MNSFNTITSYGNLTLEKFINNFKEADFFITAYNKTGECLTLMKTPKDIFTGIKDVDTFKNKNIIGFDLRYIELENLFIAYIMLED